MAKTGKEIIEEMYGKPVPSKRGSERSEIESESLREARKIIEEMYGKPKLDKESVSDEELIGIEMMQREVVKANAKRPNSELTDRELMQRIVAEGEARRAAKKKIRQPRKKETDRELMQRIVREGKARRRKAELKEMDISKRKEIANMSTKKRFALGVGSGLMGTFQNIVH